jgi:hypothetical protein
MGRKIGTVVLTRDEARALHELARREGVSVQEYLRRLLLAEAARKGLLEGRNE